MCGIVGYYGPRNPKEIILQGLRELEYRGYDSAGVAILHHGALKRVRAEGKLVNLESKLSDEEFDGHLGIGHTRWATHGPPSERNAHPHSAGGVSIVHNGIIENYGELKEELRKKGTVFSSDTDSELIACMLSEEVQGGRSILDAVLKVVPRLRGAYAVLAVSQDYPEELIAFKNGPPLIVGIGEGATLVASDAQAIVKHTRKVIYLNDHEIARIKKNQVDLFTVEGAPIKRKPTELNWTAQVSEKQGYPHFMLKEIFEQPRAVAMAISPHIDSSNHTVKLRQVGFGVPLERLEAVDIEQDWRKSQELLAKIEKIMIVACGTSYYAGLTGKYWIERFARVPVECDVASEFRYRHPVIGQNTLVLTISQSGETADTLAALRLAKSLGAQTLSICNGRHSTIDREASGHLYMNSGPEIGVASTKAFVSTLGLLNVLAVAMGKIKGQLSVADEKKQIEHLLAAPPLMETVLNYNTFFAEAATTLTRYKGFLYLGRGVHFPIALEGALKLKELAYMHAEGYAAGEMKHGPLALIDDSMAVVTLAPQDELFEKTLSNLEEAKARGGKIISIGSGNDERLKRLSEHYLSLPEAHWTINPILEVIPLQLLAYHVASALGFDVDQPRNLAKSVTVE